MHKWNVSHYNSAKSYLAATNIHNVCMRSVITLQKIHNDAKKILEPNYNVPFGLCNETKKVLFVGKLLNYAKF